MILHFSSVYNILPVPILMIMNAVNPLFLLVKENVLLKKSSIIVNAFSAKTSLSIHSFYT